MNKTILTVDHAYDGGSKIELYFTGRLTSATLSEIVADLAQSFTTDVIMVDTRGADFQLADYVERELELGEYRPPVVPVNNAADWSDRLYEARELVK
jgi:hypothetical protein